MSVRKEDLHQLIELVSDHDTELVYDLIKAVIEKDHNKEITIEADNSPLTDEEIEILKQADIDIKNNDLVDWEDING